MERIICYIYNTKIENKLQNTNFTFYIKLFELLILENGFASPIIIYLVKLISSSFKSLFLLGMVKIKIMEIICDIT